MSADRKIRHGYWFVLAPRGYKGQRLGRYVAEHRLIVERRIGRVLDPGEVVHHKNGDRLDNRPSNLVLMDAGHHARLHHPKRSLARMGRSSVRISIICKRLLDRMGDHYGFNMTSMVEFLVREKARAMGIDTD